jgi:hypothetical protein
MTATGIHAHPSKKLGKRAPSTKKAIPFAGLVSIVPTHPISADDTNHLTFNMDGNDQWGDCVVAGWDHFRQVVTSLLTGTGKTFSTEEIVAFYRTQNPKFDPDNYDEANDNGMVIQDFLGYLQKNGYILGFAKVDHTSGDDVKAAIYLGLAVIIGVDLETAQQSQSVWDYKRSGEWGGHCVTTVKYTGSPDQQTCVTWGELQPMTENFLAQQCDECWFVITQDHVDHPAFREGFDLQKFADAFKTLTGRDFPAVVPAPQPTPTPAPVPGPTPTPTPTDPKAVADAEFIAAADKWANAPHVWHQATVAAKAYKTWKATR